MKACFGLKEIQVSSMNWFIAAVMAFLASLPAEKEYR